jgi:hypothetical protein
MVIEINYGDWKLVTNYGDQKLAIENFQSPNSMTKGWKFGH